MESLKAANSGLRFLLELCALASLCYWGFHTGDSTAADIVLGIGAPLLMAIIWGIFVSPRARVRLPSFPKFVLGVVILVLAAVALSNAGFPGLAIAFEVLIAVNAVLMIMLDQNP
ncbi:MAG: YrdB family protein [Thermomicrobiales bacterium]